MSDVFPFLPHHVIWKEVAAAARAILEGSMLVIDPSCGSRSSMPGWAFFQAGKREESGIIALDVEESLPVRLRQLGLWLQTGKPRVDVLVCEQISATSWVAARATVHASLLKSVGAILASVDREKTVMIRPRDWTRLKQPDYCKGDEQDAIAMGQVVISIAQEIEKWEVGKRKKSKKKRRKR